MANVFPGLVREFGCTPTYKNFLSGAQPTGNPQLKQIQCGALRSPEQRPPPCFQPALGFH